MVVDLKILFIEDDMNFINKFLPIIQDFFKTLISNVIIDVISDSFTIDMDAMSYDIIFIDIDLNSKHVNGLKIATQIKNDSENKTVVFVSSRVGLVHKALEVQPLYFVRKNYLENDTQVLFSILRKMINRRTKVTLFEYKGKRVSLFYDDILYAESMGQNIILHTKSMNYEFRSNFANLISKFSEVNFVQIHKSFVINIDKIVELKKNEVLLDNNITLSIGRKYKDIVTEKYKERLLYDF